MPTIFVDFNVGKNWTTPLARQLLFFVPEVTTGRLSENLMLIIHWKEDRNVKAIVGRLQKVWPLPKSSLLC